MSAEGVIMNVKELIASQPPEAIAALLLDTAGIPLGSIMLKH